jgi:hypothetical protein
MAYPTVAEEAATRADLSVVVKGHDYRHQVSTAWVQHRGADQREVIVKVDDVWFEGPKHSADLASCTRAPHDLSGDGGLLAERETVDVVALAFEVPDLVTGPRQGFGLLVDHAVLTARGVRAVPVVDHQDLHASSRSAASSVGAAGTSSDAAIVRSSR